MTTNSPVSNNSLAFVGLATEFCNVIENAREVEKDEFIDAMLRLLPRIYISATDIPTSETNDIYIENHIDEDYYDSIRRSIEMLLGPDDVYLEVFEADMKYSDTPIADTISESLADIFQDLYNVASMVKASPIEIIDEIIQAAKENFVAYWSQKLCNVFRAINNLKYNQYNQ